ncbi:SusD/RagB family nutrient-binding outer membrane lipoprotein [Bacteroidota bacterium]
MKNTFIIILIATLLAACTDDFDDYNIDKKRPAEVPGNVVFTSGLKNLVDQMSTPNVNLNIFRLIAQYWTETTYTDEANYDLVNRTIPDFTFRGYYRDALKDLDEAAKLITAEETLTAAEATAKQNRLAIIELVNCYAYQNLVDIFGNVPYTEALDLTQVTPAYDDAWTIYQALISRVNTAIGQLDNSAGSFGGQDLIYHGDVDSWITFGQSLKLKLGITISDHDNAMAQTLVEAAVAAGVITSAADNALLNYMGAPPNSNPVHDELVLTGRKDFVGANTTVDIMNALADPRLAAYYTQVDTSTETGVEKLAYVGGVYGANSSYSLHSHVNPSITAATFPGIMFTHDEMLFYIAEAAERGYSVGMTAEAAYDAAITASFDFWDISGVASYLAKPEVAYTRAPGTWKERIAKQAYLAFYTRGLEAWTEWRRLDFPVFAMPPNPFTNTIPNRFIYPINEQTLNPDNYTTAAAAMGGDIVDNKIFWDKQ